MSRADINKMTPEIEKFCTDFWDNNHMQPAGPYSQPMSQAPTMTFLTGLGGPNWGPLSYNPQLGLVFINAQNSASFQPARALPPGGEVFGAPPAGGGQGGGRGGARAGRGGGQVGGALRADSFSYKLPNGATVPCYAGPYGVLVAVDVNRGEIAWTSTLGINESLASLGDAGLKSGALNLGGSIATASGLVFIAATNDRRFRAFDAKSGKELWVAELPASGHATPMTYMGKDGSQYVVIAASGGTAVGVGLPTSDSLVAFRLPK